LESKLYSLSFSASDFQQSLLILADIEFSLITMILGICGSPRKQATEYVLVEALSILEKMGFEIKLFTVRGKNIGFCQHCDYCLRNK